MKVKIEGREIHATIREHRCREFVGAELTIGGRSVGIADTMSAHYELVEASHRERELLRGCGFRVRGL